MTYNRFEDALLIWSGACNLSGIARALVKACDAAREDGIQQSEDLAIRAIVAQLAYLCKADILGGLAGISDIQKALEAKIAESTHG